MFELVLNPATVEQRRVRFTVSEADIDDAVGYGRAGRGEPLDRQIADAAYHMVMELRVAPIDDVANRPWVLLHRGRIVWRSAGAATVHESDLG